MLVNIINVFVLVGNKYYTCNVGKDLSFFSVLFFSGLLFVTLYISTFFPKSFRSISCLEQFDLVKSRDWFYSNLVTLLRYLH